MKMKLISAILVFAIVFSFAPVSFATSEKTIDSIAEETITIETSTDENGTMRTCFLNIGNFVERVKNELSFVSSYEIGYYILTLIGQDVCALSENEIIAATSYKEVTTTTYSVSRSQGTEGGPTTFEVINNEYGSMEITITVALTKTLNGKQHYTISADQKWNGLPGGNTVSSNIRRLDSLALNHNTNTDDTVDAAGYYRSEFTCSSCGTYNNKVTHIYETNTVAQDGVDLQYSNGYPYIQFTAPWRTCSKCATKAENEIISSHLAYGVKVDINETANVYASYFYAHNGTGTYTINISDDDIGFGYTIGTVQTREFGTSATTIN